jgi:hypothetical protein
MHTAFERITDTIPLTTQEKSRFAELEGIVETHLEAFLAVGRALAEIRNKRLYRQDFATWEDYCTRKWGLGYSRANELVRSTEIAEGFARELCRSARRLTVTARSIIPRCLAATPEDCVESKAKHELTQAFEAGEISLRQYDLRSRLGIRQQKRLIAAQKAKRTDCR